MYQAIWVDILRYFSQMFSWVDLIYNNFLSSTKGGAVAKMLSNNQMTKLWLKGPIPSILVVLFIS